MARKRQRLRETQTKALGWPTGPVETGLTQVELLVDRDRPSRVTLMLDGMESSHLDLADPSHLEFEYMQHFTCALDARGPGPVRAMHLGGAACALARAWDVLRPGSRQLAVEYDGELAKLVREWFALPRSPQLRIRVGDVREAVANTGEASWDVIVRDAFVDGACPAHLRTLEFLTLVRTALRPGGQFFANITDRPPFSSARAEIATIRAAFAHVAIISEPAIFSGRRYGNLAVIAGDEPLEVAEMERLVRRLAFPTRVLTGPGVGAFTGGAKPLRDPGPVAADGPEPGPAPAAGHPES